MPACRRLDAIGLADDVLDESHVVRSPHSGERDNQHDQNRFDAHEFSLCALHESGAAPARGPELRHAHIQNSIDVDFFKHYSGYLFSADLTCPIEDTRGAVSSP